MRIRHLKRPRLVFHEGELTGPEPGTPVLSRDGYEAFKLRIRKRETDPATGEADFLIRSLTNNLRYILVYCLMDEPGQVHSVLFWVNNKVLLPSGTVEYTEPLIDDEQAAYMVMDFIESHVKKNYTPVPENLRQN